MARAIKHLAKPSPPARHGSIAPTDVLCDKSLKIEADEIEELASDITAVRRKMWRKSPDRTLGEHLNNKWRVRQERGGNEPTTSKLREEAIRRSKRRPGFH
jgi:hypothetical protein